MYRAKLCAHIRVNQELEKVWLLLDRGEERGSEIPISAMTIQAGLPLSRDLKPDLEPGLVTDG